MRWFWIDRFEEFVRRRRATAIKAVTLAEEHLHDHFPGVPIVPNSLVLEGLAQTAGILVADAVDFRRRVVLAKVGSSEFRFDARPGDVLRFDVEILECSEQGSAVRATSSVADRLQGEADLFFGHIPPGGAVPSLFSPEQLNRWLDNLRIFDVACEEDGTRVTRDRVRAEG